MGSHCRHATAVVWLFNTFTSNTDETIVAIVIYGVWALRTTRYPRGTDVEAAGGAREPVERVASLPPLSRTCTKGPAEPKEPVDGVGDRCAT